MTIASKLNKSGISSADLARKIGVSAAEIYQWKKGIRPIPVERCAAIERATNGAVTRRDLRPDDWHRIWPELAEKEGADV